MGGLRKLPEDEWFRLKPVFEQQGASMPDPSRAVILVYEDAGEEPPSFLVLQSVLHCEPLYLAPLHRFGKGLPELIKAATFLAKGENVMMVADSPSSARLLAVIKDELGLERVESPVYVRKC